MTFLAPLFLWGALAAAAGVLGLHFLVTRPPPVTPFPTARFIPEGPVVITTLTDRPQDRVLLSLRVLLLLLLGAAFARPVIGLHHEALLRVLLVDRSRASATDEEVRDSLARLRRPGDIVIAFDTTARRLGQTESLPSRSEATGALGAALVAAIRAGGELATRADSIELVLLSPLAAQEWSEAVPPIRALWPGRIRMAPLTPWHDSTPPPGAGVRAAANDPVRDAISLIGGPGPGIRLLRTAVLPEDRDWVRRGGALVHWPVEGAPAGWRPRDQPDTVGAVVSNGSVLVHPFVRRWQADSLSPGTTVRARWVDGEPAAITTRDGPGCVTEVALPVPSHGDLVLRPEFLRLLRALLSPCTGRPISPLPLAARANLLGAGPLASAASLRPGADPPTPLVPWLLGAALLSGLAELALRRRPAVSTGPTG